MSEDNSKKVILDACCGRKAMWLDKNNPFTLYLDIRDDGFITPNIKGDFRNLSFPNKSFKLVVFDPPHILQREGSKESTTTKYYGMLNPDTWKEDIKKGFEECWRVLDDNGVLIFKWSNCDKWSNKNAKDKDVIDLLPIKPLFKQNASKTSIWMCFMKLPTNALSIKQ